MQKFVQGMGQKSALAGLWAGGGKGVIHQPPNHRDPAVRRDVFFDYGDFLTSLNGCYGMLITLWC